MDLHVFHTHSDNSGVVVVTHNLISLLTWALFCKRVSALGKFRHGFQTYIAIVFKQKL